MCVKSKRQVRRHNRDIFSIFFNMKVYCVFSLESPHRGDSNEYTQYTIYNIKKKITLNLTKSAATGFFLGTQQRVRNSRGKRAISARAIEVLLYKVYRESSCFPSILRRETSFVSLFASLRDGTFFFFFFKKRIFKGKLFFL